MCPPDINDVLDHFKKVPKTKIYKISTIPNGSDVSLDQFRKYVSKFSDKYFIVQGAATGKHYHGLLSLDRPLKRWLKQKISPNRGFAQLFPKKDNPYFNASDIEEIDKANYIRQKITTESVIQTTPSQHLAVALCIQKKYDEFIRKEKARFKRMDSQQKYQKEYTRAITGWYNYLIGNINENAPPHKKYIHYYMR